MPRRILEGEVVSDRMDKTVTVLVERKTMHPVYKKYVRSTKRYAAHDENNQFKTGDSVRIEECSPISKRKRWTVVMDGIAPVAYKPRERKLVEKEEMRPASKSKKKNEALKAEAAAQQPKEEAKKPAAKKETKKK